MSIDRAKKRVIERNRRAVRIREKVIGTSQRPRLCVRRSLKHISACIIDDGCGRVLAAASSASKEIAGRVASGKRPTKTEISKIVGEAIAEKAKAQGIGKIVFDRKGYDYHGRVKALAEAVRGKGLVF